MPNKDKALFPEIKVLTCPKCKSHFKKGLEPYMISVEPDVPGVGLECPECGHSVRWVITNALPLPIDSFNACIGAISQLVKVAWYSHKRMEVVWLDHYVMLKSWAPQLQQMQEQLNALDGGTDAKS